MSVRVPEVPTHGPGVWKLNLSVLNDSDYVSIITNFWRAFLKTPENFTGPKSHP